METRTNFHNHLKELQTDIISMSNSVGTAIEESIEALKGRDLHLAQRLIDQDALINAKRFEITEKCISLMATQQPVAEDLRILMSSILITVELERIGDYAEGISRIVILNDKDASLKPLLDLPRMAQRILEMLQESMKAFADYDAQAAITVCKKDDEIDQLYNQVFNELLLMMVEDPRIITKATRLIWVAHNLERSADRVTNICEQIAYIASGIMEEIGASKY